MFTPQSLLTTLKKQRYGTLKTLAEQVVSVSERMETPVSYVKAYQLTRLNLCYLERQKKIVKTAKGKTIFIEASQQHQVMREFKNGILKRIRQGHNTPSQLKTVSVTPNGETLAVDLIAQLLQELETSGEVNRVGTKTKGRSKIYTLRQAKAEQDNRAQTEHDNARTHHRRARVLHAIGQNFMRQSSCSPQQIALASQSDVYDAKNDLTALHEAGLLIQKQIGAMLLYTLDPLYADRLETLNWPITAQAHADGVKFTCTLDEPPPPSSTPQKTTSTKTRAPQRQLRRTYARQPNHHHNSQTATPLTDPTGPPHNCYSRGSPPLGQSPPHTHTPEPPSFRLPRTSVLHHRRTTSLLSHPDFYTNSQEA